MFKCCFPSTSSCIQLQPSSSEIISPLEKSSNSFDENYSFHPHLPSSKRQLNHKSTISSDEYKHFTASTLENTNRQSKQEINTQIININPNNQPRGSIITLTDINFPRNDLTFSQSSSNSSSETSKVTISSQMYIQQMIPDDIDNTFPYLILHEQNILNKKFIITPQGYKESPRFNCDGFVFFGTISSNNNNEIINDVVLNNKDININNEHLFIIYFHLKKKKYFIRKANDNNDNVNANFMIKITSSYKLSNKDVIIINNQLFLINIIHSEENNMLQITQVKNNKKQIEQKIYIYKPSKSKITIGRDKCCSICFENDKSFSKIHSTIYYDMNTQGWFIKDGGEKESLNGTWIISKHSVELNHNTEIKLIELNMKFTIMFVSKD